MSVKNNVEKSRKILNQMESKCSKCGKVVKGAANIDRHRKACKNNSKECLNERCKNVFCSPKERSFCSQDCFLESFKRGEYSTANKVANYRTICFEHHDHKCVCCEEENILDVHHFDENHENNSPDNLIPLCPTHHRYVHNKKFKKEYKSIINKYLMKWRNR